MYGSEAKKNPDLTSKLTIGFIHKSIKNEAKVLYKAVATPLVLLIITVLLYKPYQQWSFNNILQNNPPLKEQLEAVGGKIQSITALKIDASNEQILRGKISFFKELRGLNIYRSEIEDLSNLNRLDSLRVLVVSENSRLQNMNGLEQLPSLTSLEATGNSNLTSLKGIVQLKSLTSLVISDNNLTS